MVGIVDALRWSDDKQRSQLLQKVIVNDVGRFMVNELKKRGHRWEKRKTGKHMVDTIGMTPVGNEVLVIVPKPYAQIENDRKGTKPGHGTHNFADQSEQQTITYYTPRIRTKYDDFFNAR